MRLGHHRAAEGQHLLLATRQRARLLACTLVQAGEHVEDLPHEAVYLGAVLTVLKSAELQVLTHREEWKNTPTFGDKRDPESSTLIRRQARNVLSAETDRAGARQERAGDGTQRGGFSGTVCADQRYYLTRIDMKTDVAAGRNLAIRKLESFRCQQRAHIKLQGRRRPRLDRLGLRPARPRKDTVRNP